MSTANPQAWESAWDRYQKRYAALYGPAFDRAYGEAYEAHAHFARMAVYPTLFSVDLLYQIWFNFRVYPGRDTQRLIGLPNFLVSDFLLSGLCQSVGFGLYGVDPGLRRKLVGELEADPRFGPERVRSLAALLDRYREHAYVGVDADGLNTYHGWLAQSTLDPEAAAERMAHALAEAIETQNQPEIQRLAYLLRQFAERDAAFEGLATYAEAMSGRVVVQTPVLRARKPDGPAWEVPGPLPEALRDLVVREEGEDEEASGPQPGIPEPFVRGKNKLYAVLVAPEVHADSRIARAEGSLNALRSWQEFLRARVRQGLELRVLAREAATKAAMVRELLDIAAEAQPGDGVFFFFAGHGEMEAPFGAASKSNIGIEANAPAATGLVFYDSEPGSPDSLLTQDELSLLLQRVGWKSANMCGVLDAGIEAATADYEIATARLAPTLDLLAKEFDPDDAPAYPEILFRYSLFTAGSLSESLSRTNREIPQIQEEEEEAAHAQFSYNMLEALRNASSPLSCQDLLKQTRLKLRQADLSQTPQLYTANGADPNQPFLFGALEARPHRFLVHFDAIDNSWKLDAGRVHGMPRIQKDRPPRIALFPAGTPSLAEARPVAEVALKRLFRAHTTLGEGSESLDPAQTYRAVLTSMPPERLRLKMVREGPEASVTQKEAPLGEAPALSEQMQLLEEFIAYEPHARFLEIDREQADYEVIFDAAGRFDRVVRAADGRQMFDRQQVGTEKESLADELVDFARRMRRETLQNPLTELEGALEVRAFEFEGEKESPLAQSSTILVDEGESEKRIRFHLKNISNTWFYVFGPFAYYHALGMERAVYFAADHEGTISFNISLENAKRYGLKFRWIVSERGFNETLVRIPNTIEPADPAPPASALEAIFHEDSRTREIPAERLRFGDWHTGSFELTIEWPQKIDHLPLDMALVRRMQGDLRDYTGYRSLWPFASLIEPGWIGEQKNWQFELENTTQRLDRPLSVERSPAQFRDGRTREDDAMPEIVLSSPGVDVERRDTPDRLYRRIVFPEPGYYLRLVGLEAERITDPARQRAWLEEAAKAGEFSPKTDMMAEIVHARRALVVFAGEGDAFVELSTAAVEGETPDFVFDLKRDWRIEDARGIAYDLLNAADLRPMYRLLGEVEEEPVYDFPVPEMVRVEGGSFMMGSEDEEAYDNEKPIHEVRVDNFYLGKYPVTFDEYDAFCEATGREKPHDKSWGRGRRPVINVSWDDATAYAAWLSEQTAQSWRLPTEAEWEYAAGGGSENRTKWTGTNEESALGDYAWYNDNSGGQTRLVGRKRPNALGLYDMSGNVYEWCQDWYGSDYYATCQRQGTVRNPQGPDTGSFRVGRGGSWYGAPRYCRVAYRYYFTPTRRSLRLGFRLARTP